VANHASCCRGYSKLRRCFDVLEHLHFRSVIFVDSDRHADFTSLETRLDVLDLQGALNLLTGPRLLPFVAISRVWGVAFLVDEDCI